MNKSPLETGRATELTNGERMDLIVWSSSPSFEVVCKVLENKVLSFRDEAMAVDPAEEVVQRARMTEAHAAAKFYQWFRNEIKMASSNELAKLQEKANRALLQDQEVIENIIVASASGSVI